MRLKKWFAAGAVPVAVVAGVGVASAQSTADTTDDTTTGDAPADDNDGARSRGRGGRGLLRGLAATLDLTKDEIRAAIEAGDTIADLAAANGVDIDQAISDLVSQAQSRADESGRDDFDAEALTERLTAAVNGEAEFPRGGHGRHGAHGFRGGLASVEELLGIDGAEIRDALRAGHTLAEVAEDHGIGLDELVSTIVDDIETRLEESGRELPEGATTESLTERVTERVTSDPSDRAGRGEGRRGPRGFGRGGPHGPNGPTDAPAEGTAA